MTTPQTPAKREKRVTAKDVYDYGMEAWGRQADQVSAGYNALGGMAGGQACANCLFFISPNGCTVVEDWPVSISPTGLSKFWTAIPAAEDYPPMRVVIVEDTAAVSENQMSKGLVERIVAAVKSAFTGLNAPVVGAVAASTKQEASAFRVYKEVGGEWRWVALVSNKFRDRDNNPGPEIITEAAHKEYVGYLDESGDYPEAWLWHTPGTRWGRADWAEYADGFLLMSGTVDKGMEAVALSLSGESLGVSHGFFQRYENQAKGIIGWYRTFEVSALPPEVAANPWTGLSVIQKEAGMAISATKRQFLEGKLGKERVAALEGDVSALAKALQEAGVEYKDILSVSDGDAPASVSLSAKDIADAVTAALTPTTEAVAALGASMTSVKAVSEASAATLTALSERVKALEASDDEKIAAQFIAKATSGAAGGYRATAAKDNVTTEEAVKENAPVLPGAQQAWMRAALPFAGE